MVDIESWWESGELVPIGLGGVEREIFVHSEGSGASLTLLHGFPSSSHDWAKLAPLLPGRALLMPDFLGFGASAKPAEHVYSLREQADLVVGLWQRRGIKSTSIVAHDYAVSVAQELLARRAEGTLPVEIEAIHLMNGGVYPDLHRPQPLQVALLDPEQGPQISAMVNEELFVAGLAPTFAADFDARADSIDIWRSTHRNGGERNSHLLIRYMTDREVDGERWTTAMEHTDVPLSFIWGMLDPVSGAQMAARIRRRLPASRFLALEDVGHWPALEDPAKVAEAIRAG
jgi:pimeloyl-ACP methyl ester carboxylesterase